MPIVTVRGSTTRSNTALGLDRTWWAGTSASVRYAVGFAGAVKESETRMFNDRLASSTRPWDSKNRGDSGSLRRYRTTSRAGRAKNTNVHRQTRSSPPSPAASGPSSRKNSP